MIYASDLDRTLIYSQSFLDLHPCNDNMILVDKSKVNSFIAEKVLNKLKKISYKSDVIFVPTTTRSTAEYNRIKLPGLKPKYAIVSNGGVILEDGKPLESWSKVLESLIDFEEMQKILVDMQEISGSFYKAKIIDNCFIFSKVDNIKSAKDKLNELSKKYPYYNFMIEKSKIYGLPCIVSKVSALRYLSDKLGEKVVVASGDSEFDVPMLKLARVPVIPSHGKISEASKSKVGFHVKADGLALSPMKTLSIVDSLTETV